MIDEKAKMQNIIRIEFLKELYDIWMDKRDSRCIKKPIDLSDLDDNENSEMNHLLHQLFYALKIERGCENIFEDQIILGVRLDKLNENYMVFYGFFKVLLEGKVKTLFKKIMKNLSLI